MELMAEILAAETRVKNIKGGVQTTPLAFSSRLSEISGCELYLKNEHLQRTGSFKFRGALNKIASLEPPTRRKGIVAASTGNHGMGVALATRLFGVEAAIYAPESASELKLCNISDLGARLHTVKGGCLEAELAARKAAQELGREFISPYNDLQIMAGQGTLGLELVHQRPLLDAVFISVGGGGLIGGVGRALKNHNPNLEVVGCWAENSPVLYKCMDAGRITEVPELPTISDGTAGGIEPGAITLPICQQVIDQRVLVTEAEIKQAMKYLAQYERWMVEGAAAVALAACLKTASRYQGKKVAIVLCGRNISLEVFLDAMGSVDGVA